MQEISLHTIIHGLGCNVCMHVYPTHTCIIGNSCSAEIGTSPYWMMVKRSKESELCCACAIHRVGILNCTIMLLGNIGLLYTWYQCSIWFQVLRLLCMHVPGL